MPALLRVVNPAMVTGIKRMRGRAWMALRELVMIRDAMTCQSCGLVTPDIEVDHITPVCRGGNNALSNLQCLCAVCHRAKSQADAARA